MLYRLNTNFILVVLALMPLFSHAKDNPSCYCKPHQTCWPGKQAWQALNKRVLGRLMKVSSPLEPCMKNSKSPACQNTLEKLKNPFYIESTPGATQLTGWYKAWQSSPSNYVVAVESAEDIAHTVRFAKKHHIKLVIKGTGHDYLGRSNAPDSLLIWTHKMRDLKLHDHFIPEGCDKTSKGYPALTAQAGSRWIEAYKKTAVDNHRYVQGGGCTSVGVSGGFMQGGGFGSWSKKFGIGAAGLLEAEVVTADGNILTVNQCQHPDLFWALKGGGGGTFGVVSKVTLLTHPLPETLGVLNGRLIAKNDEAYQLLIKKFLLFYRKHLNNEKWGEQVSIKSNNQLELHLAFVDLDENSLNKIWQPFINELNQTPDQFKAEIKPVFIPGDKFWDIEYRRKNLPQSIVINPLSQQNNTYWWEGNNSEVSLYGHYYLSRYLPQQLLQDNRIDNLATAFYKASRNSDNLIIHFNKGQ